MDKGKGPFIILGNSKAKDARYAFDTDIRVKQGEKVTTKRNPFLTLRDPRKGSKDPSKIPDMIQYEIILVDEQE